MQMLPNSGAGSMSFGQLVPLPRPVVTADGSEKEREKWRQVLLVVAPTVGEGKANRAEVDRILSTCQGSEIGQYVKGNELRAPPLDDEGEWARIASRLRSGQIVNVVFCSTESVHSDDECKHSNSVALENGLIPCYGPTTRRSERGRQLGERLDTYVNWEWASAYWRKQENEPCPEFCRLLTLANSEGVSVHVDFYKLGGCPKPIKELLNETRVAKVFFGLKAQWRSLRVAICGLEPAAINSFYDAEFYHFPSKRGEHFIRKLIPTWRNRGVQPTLPTVVCRWLEGKSEPPSDGEAVVLCTGSLASLAELFCNGPRLHRSGAQELPSSWLVDKPKELAEDDRICALEKAICLPMVYLGGLLSVPIWRDAALAHEEVLTWLQLQLQPLSERQALVERAASIFDKRRRELNASLGRLRRKKEAALDSHMRDETIRTWYCGVIDAAGREDVGSFTEYRRLCWNFAVMRLFDKWDMVGYERHRERKRRYKRLRRKRLAEASRGEGSVEGGGASVGNDHDMGANEEARDDDIGEEPEFEFLDD